MGWLKTVDEYRSGDNSAAQAASVENVYDGVIDELAKDPKRRFCFAEISYFSVWYDRLSQDKKKTIKEIIKTHQIDFVNGGWSANDEASPNFENIINNM